MALGAFDVVVMQRLLLQAFHAEVDRFSLAGWGGNRSGTLYGETCVTRVVNVGPTSTLEGCRESTSNLGLTNRFKVDPHDLGQIDIGSPSNDIESKGPDVQRSSGRRCFFLHRLFPVE